MVHIFIDVSKLSRTNDGVLHMPGWFNCAVGESCFQIQLPKDVSRQTFKQYSRRSLFRSHVFVKDWRNVMKSFKRWPLFRVQTVTLWNVTPRQWDILWGKGSRLKLLEWCDIDLKTKA